MLHVRQADFLDHGTELLQLFNAVLDQLGDARVETGAEVFLRHADAQALQRRIEAGGVIRHGLIDAGGVVLIEAGHTLQQNCAVFGSARQRAALIEAGSVSDHAPARNAAVGRLQAREVGECGWLTDRTTRVSGSRRWQQTSGNRRRRTTGRTARHVFQVPRVFHRAVPARLVGRTHGEFVHVGLAQGHGAGSRQFRNHGGVIRGLEVVEHLRAAAGANALGAEQVFVGDRRAEQGAALTVGPSHIGGFRLLEGQLFGEADETVELRIELGDTRQQDFGQLFGGKLFIGETAGDLGQSHLMHCRLFPFSR